MDGTDEMKVEGDDSDNEADNTNDNPASDEVGNHTDVHDRMSRFSNRAAHKRNQS